MNVQPSLARHLESFFHRRLTQQRNATPATVKAYRDALRLLVLFASERTGKKPCALAVGDLDRDMILEYLDHLERSRGNSVHTRNARLTATIILPSHRGKRSRVNRCCATCARDTEQEVRCSDDTLPFQS